MNLLTRSLLAAVDWDEYQRDGHELPPSTVEWIEKKRQTKRQFRVYGASKGGRTE